MSAMQKAKKMKLSDYEIHHTLGTGSKNPSNFIIIFAIFIGSFGRVKLARNKITNKWVALKILKKAEIIRLKQVDHVINENTLLSNIDHPFIVKKKRVIFLGPFLIAGVHGRVLPR